MHHTSPDVWKLKIIDSLSMHKDCYMASRENGSGCIIIRLVNEQVLGEIKSGDIIEAQVVGMAMAIDIFEDEGVAKQIADKLSTEYDVKTQQIIWKNHEYRLI